MQNAFTENGNHRTLFCGEISVYEWLDQKQSENQSPTLSKVAVTVKRLLNKIKAYIGM